MGPDHEFWRAAISNQEELLRSLLRLFSPQVVTEVLTKKAEDRKDCVYYFDFNYGKLVPPPFNHQDVYGWTILHYAVLNDNANIIQLLLDYGAKINSQTTKGETALHIASARGNVEVCKLLLKNGADFRLVNQAGKTALDMSSNMEISNALMKLSNNHTLSDLCMLTIAKNIKNFTSFACLPQDLVERVFTFLKKYNKIDTETIAYFRNLLYDIDVPYYRGVSDELLMEISNHTRLIKLNISSSEPTITNNGISYLQDLQNLRELNISGCPNVSLQAVCDLLRANPNLKNVLRGRRSFVRVAYGTSEEYHPSCCVCKQKITNEAVFYYTEHTTFTEFPTQQEIPCWHIHHMHSCNQCGQLISDPNGVCIRTNIEGSYSEGHLKIANITEEDSEKLIFQPSVKYYHMEHITNK